MASKGCLGNSSWWKAGIVKSISRESWPAYKDSRVCKNLWTHVNEPRDKSPASVTPKGVDVLQVFALQVKPRSEDWSNCHVLNCDRCASLNLRPDQHSNSKPPSIMISLMEAWDCNTLLSHFAIMKRGSGKLSLRSLGIFCLLKEVIMLPYAQAKTLTPLSSLAPCRPLSVQVTRKWEDPPNWILKVGPMKLACHGRFAKIAKWPKYNELRSWLQIDSKTSLHVRLGIYSCWVAAKHRKNPAMLLRVAPTVSKQWVICMQVEL